MGQTLIIAKTRMKKWFIHLMKAAKVDPYRTCPNQLSLDISFVCTWSRPKSSAHGGVPFWEYTPCDKYLLLCGTWTCLNRMDLIASWLFLKECVLVILCSPNGIFNRLWFAEYSFQTGEFVLETTMTMLVFLSELVHIPV